MFLGVFLGESCNYVDFSCIFAELCGIRANPTTLEEVDNIFSP